MTEVLETALYAADLEATAAFYERVVGLERVMAEPGRHVFLRAGLTMVLLFDPQASARPPGEGAIAVPPHGATGPGHLCFTAEPVGIEGWEARLAGAGVAVEHRLRWPHGPRSLYCRDPAGNSIEFAETALWGPRPAAPAA
ncbi:MAG: VOC family protein [Pseudomonadota bacterium]